jgi:ribosomal protein L13E
MKSIIKVLSLYYFLFILLVDLSPIYSQNKIDLYTGFGIPELINAGVKFQSSQKQVGLSIGSRPNEDIISVSGDIYYHFGGHSKLSNRRPWYVRGGLNILREETSYAIHKYVNLNTRIGRDFNISNKIGISLGAGILVGLFHDEIRKKPKGSLEINLGFPVIPSLGISLFYRI